MRKKLIELIRGADSYTLRSNDCHRIVGNDTDCAVLADILIANGVTVREQGEWINKTRICEKNGRKFADYRFDCSSCGRIFWFAFDDFSYCPNCGADMRGDT